MRSRTFGGRWASRYAELRVGGYNGRVPAPAGRNSIGTTKSELWPPLPALSFLFRRRKGFRILALCIGSRDGCGRRDRVDSDREAEGLK
jgi:hypothetical protein